MPVESLGALPPNDTVVLLCPFGKFDKKDDGTTFLRLTPDAFRVDDDGISVVWVEYFKPPPPSIEQAAAALKTERSPTKTGVLAQATVSRILELAKKDGIEAAVTHSPTCKNHGHASITGWPDQIGVLESLALAFPTAIPNKDIPGFLDAKPASEKT